MNSDDLLPTPPDDIRAISPTDVSQFIRLEQCQRYLRLRLHEREHGLGFMRDGGMQPQNMPISLTRSGDEFEARIESEIATAGMEWHGFSSEDRQLRGVSNDNLAVAEIAATLSPGQIRVLGQPRLQARAGRWSLTGDVDLLRLERKRSGVLSVLIADMKSSDSPKVEHRLQVAFYREMLAGVLDRRNLGALEIRLGVLYRGPATIDDTMLQPDALTLLAEHKAAASEAFGPSSGYLEIIANPEAYEASARDLVLAPDSKAMRVIGTHLNDLPFSLTSKCDGCLFNEHCMNHVEAADDLSLIPHIAEGDKTALIRAGIRTTEELADLKEILPPTADATGAHVPASRLAPAAGKAGLARKLATTWPVGARLDELVHRAKRYRRFKGDEIETLYSIPGSGYNAFPHADAQQNTNLVWIHIDAQFDHIQDRVYLLGALIVCHRHGEPDPARRRAVVRFAPSPVDSSEKERDLIVDWVRQVLIGIVDLAAPDADGEPNAPIHLTFVNDLGQRVLLDALGRHATEVLGVTALYDFVTQLAAFTSPIASHLETQIRSHRNYPMVCQSLQSVAAFLGFDWNSPEPYREIFRNRLFDFWGKREMPVDDPNLSPWFTNRARFNSQIPLEYALAAWGDLPKLADSEEEDPHTFGHITPELMVGFHTRRLEAMEHIAADFRGNDKTELSAFALPDLGNFEQKAPTLAHALDEFTTIEHHVDLAAWKNDRLIEPEQRMLNGSALIVTYREEDQDPDIAERNRENQRRYDLDGSLLADLKHANPNANRRNFTKEQKQAVTWSQNNLEFRLRVDAGNLPADLDEVLRLSTLKPGSRYIIYPRFAIDGRRPAEGQQPFNPTPKQMLYGMRANLLRFEVTRDPDGHATAAWAVVSLDVSHGNRGGFVFGTMNARPLLKEDERYTLDPDPNNWMGERGSTIGKGLIAGGRNRLHQLLEAGAHDPIDLPSAFPTAQARFLEGLDALHEAGALHEFEASKRDFIGRHATDPILLVQGPPGTGKSYSTAFALFARLQGAMTANIPYRIFLSCKTHAATDVLLHNFRDVQEMLTALSHQHPGIFGRYFDARLLTIPLFRYRPDLDFQSGITHIPQDKHRTDDSPKAVHRIEAKSWCVVAATPGGMYSLVKDQWPKSIFGNELARCLVLDEASQMNLPEGMLAALPLAMNGSLIVVGDHRQMPPIVKNDWSNEPRRTFQEFKSYESLFVTLLDRADAIIRFDESFRLHADMAEFLRREIYQQDGINYHSRKHDVIDRHELGDSFLAAVLDPDHPLTVIVHDEARSQTSNEFERMLLTPVLATLVDPSLYDLKPDNGIGVVVPHRAQRAAFQERVPDLTMYDENGDLLVSAVDTVERFQGGERTAIIVGATESDSEYLLVSGKFLLDPRRLTVALSRAKRKMILVASRSVFELFSADEETFGNAQIWKNLLRRTCTVPLWDGERHGVRVEVWGNAPSRPPSAEP